MEEEEEDAVVTVGGPTVVGFLPWKLTLASTLTALFLDSLSFMAGLL